VSDTRAPKLEMNEQLDLLASVPERVPTSGPFDVPELVSYRDQLSERAKSTGLEAARRGDPEAFAMAVQAIRDAAEEFGEFTSDDLRWSMRGGEVGAAFAHLRRLGEIEVCGHATSKRQLSHGRLLRVWRRT